MKSEIDPQDLELCRAINRKMKRGKLVLGMMSGTIFNRTDPTVTIGVIGWRAKPDCAGIAGVNASSAKVWLCLEPIEQEQTFIDEAAADWDEWVGKGGFHVPGDWWGPNQANWMTPDWMIVEEDEEGQLWAFSHFYNRWIVLCTKHDYENKGFLIEKDFRQASVFEMLGALAYSNPGFPKENQQQKFLDALGLGVPKSEFSLYDYAQHVK